MKASKADLANRSVLLFEPLAPGEARLVLQPLVTHTHTQYFDSHKTRACHSD